jgi:hypothetical protein
MKGNGPLSVNWYTSSSSAVRTSVSSLLRSTLQTHSFAPTSVHKSPDRLLHSLVLISSGCQSYKCARFCANIHNVDIVMAHKAWIQADTVCVLIDILFNLSRAWARVLLMTRLSPRIAISFRDTKGAWALRHAGRGAKASCPTRIMRCLTDIPLSPRGPRGPTPLLTVHTLVHIPLPRLQQQQLTKHQSPS